jgi:DNA-binding response OmpR family regulator
VPVILLTARDAVADTVSALDSGADDYMTKPFSFDELLARVRARLRTDRTPASDTGLCAAGISLDLRHAPGAGRRPHGRPQRSRVRAWPRCCSATRARC